MLKVAMLTPNLTFGGAERWLISLAKHLPRDRIQVTGVAVSGWGGIDPQLSVELRQVTEIHSHGTADRPAHARVFDFTGVQIHASLGEAVAAACQGADILLAWGDLSVLRAVPESVQIPLVLVSHTTRPNTSPSRVSSVSSPDAGVSRSTLTTCRRYEAATRALDAESCESSVRSPDAGGTITMPPVLRPGDGTSRVIHFAAVSESAADYFRGRPEVTTPVTVIHNGVELDRLRPTVSAAQMRVRWGVGEHSPVLGFVGRLSQEKLPEAMAVALAGLPPHWHGVMYGERTAPPQGRYAQLVHLAAADRVSDRLHIYPPVVDIGNVYHAIDVLLLPSSREAFSLTLIEAWLNGVPVVATPVGSIPELEQEFGQLVTRVPVGATKEVLSAAVLTALADTATRNRAKQLAERLFTVRVMAAKWSDYLTDLLA